MFKTDKLNLKTAEAGGKVTRRAALGLSAGAAALAACATQPEVAAPALFAGEAAFAHGVASGDPLADRVVIWTRVTPTAADTGAVLLEWTVAKDAALKEIVRSGQVETSAARDFTVKVDVDGLAPGQTYHYGFRTAGAASPVGRTRTLPPAGVAQVTLAAASCSNVPFGHFHAYKEIAKIEGLDAVLHLGDYIYEYGPDGYGAETGAALGRAHLPAKEIVTLADYRGRHAQYKADADLQAAHASAPWIVTWDDHEVTNDAWMHGAQNHTDATEGPFAARKAAALQAYYEWMPIRDPQAGRPREAINRSFQFGDLLTLIMLETRLVARSHQLEYVKDLPLLTTTWDMAGNPPRPLKPGEAAPEGAVTRPTPFRLRAKGAPQPILRWAEVEKIDPANPPKGVAFLPDVAAFEAKRAGPDRELLGAEQLAWVKAQLEAGKAAGAPWRVFGNQVIMARVNAPDLSAAPEDQIAALEKIYPPIRRLLALTKLGLPLNLDAWDGYPAERARLFELLQTIAGDTIVLTGDTHTAWANQLKTEAGARVGTEFGVTSITSPGLGNLFAGSGIDLAAAIKARNGDVAWTDQTSRGFLKLTLTKTQAAAEFHTVSTVVDTVYQTAVAASFSLASDGAGAADLQPA